MIEKVNTSENTINAWAKKFREVNPKLADSIDQGKEVGLRGVEDLNLPRWRGVSTSLSEFLKEPEAYLGQLVCDLYYVNLKPKIKDDKRFREVHLTRDQLFSFIHSHVSGEKVLDYNVTILETREILYGGSIIIDKDGRIILEARKGYQGPIADGRAVPQFSVQNDPFTNSFKYSFEDQKMREMFYNTILSIPHDFNGRDMKFPPGYYEFSMVKKEGSEELEPKFFDYRNDSAYFLKYENPIPELKISD